MANAADNAFKASWFAFIERLKQMGKGGAVIAIILQITETVVENAAWDAAKQVFKNKARSRFPGEMRASEIRQAQAEVALILDLSRQNLSTAEYQALVGWIAKLPERHKNWHNDFVLSVYDTVNLAASSNGSEDPTTNADPREDARKRIVTQFIAVAKAASEEGRDAVAQAYQWFKPADQYGLLPFVNDLQQMPWNTVRSVAEMLMATGWITEADLKKYARPEKKKDGWFTRLARNLIR